MRQSGLIILILLTVVSAGGCGKAPASTVPAGGGVVSLSPAATDLLVAMRLADRVVGVSPFEANDDLRRKLPKVGDYQRIDWERVASLHAGYLVVQGSGERLPAGTREQCLAMGMVPVVLQIDRLDDIPRAIEKIGRAMHEPAAAARCVGAFEHRRAAIAPATRPAPVPTLIVFSDSDAGTQVVGRDTFIDDALVLAGGQNVLGTAGYTTIDREKLASFKPQVVFLLLPGGTPATVARATAKLTDAAIPADAVCPITDADVLMPGTNALHLAETMARCLKGAS